MFPNFSGRVRWGAVARTLTPTGARQLIGCTGSVYFRVAGDANSLTPNNQTHTLRVRATRAKHDEWLLMIYRYFTFPLAIKIKLGYH